MLHSKAPESTLKEISAVFKANLHKNVIFCTFMRFNFSIKLEDVFDKFEPQPCGAASLAQVHKARLKATGEYVAVKVQHPHVKARSFVDMATMQVFLIRAGGCSN